LINVCTSKRPHEIDDKENIGPTVDISLRTTSFGQAANICVIMQKYKQLSLHDRHKIKALLDAGRNQSVIADLIGVRRSTITGNFSEM